MEKILYMKYQTNSYLHQKINCSCLCYGVGHLRLYHHHCQHHLSAYLWIITSSQSNRLEEEGEGYSVASLACDSSLIKLIPVTRRTCNWLLPLFLNAESSKASHTIEQYTIFPLQFCYLSMYVPGLGDVSLD